MPINELRSISTFVKAAELGSLRRAAAGSENETKGQSEKKSAKIHEAGKCPHLTARQPEGLGILSIQRSRGRSGSFLRFPPQASGGRIGRMLRMNVGNEKSSAAEYSSGGSTPISMCLLPAGAVCSFQDRGARLCGQIRGTHPAPKPCDQALAGTW